MGAKIMANGLLDNTPFTSGDALGALGIGLLKMSSGNKQDPLQSLAIWKALMANKANQSAGESFQGINPSYTLPENTTDDAVDRLMRSIGKLESGNNYAVIGPRTRSGDRAYGQYQVMGENIPVWSQEVLGYALTPEQFLRDKEAQDKIARAKLGGYLKQYGNINDAASMWFSGRPFKGNTRRDIIGTSVPQYVATVNKYF